MEHRIARSGNNSLLDDLGRDIALPEVTRHAIMNYPLPDYLLLACTLILLKPL